ncbi:MAG TPA: hypothetical protein VHQ04_12985, partial [Puia sp.]|nr:hypothetical protein [Puia sp.]
DFTGSVYFLLKKKSGISKAMIKAILAYFYWLFFYRKKRNLQPRGFNNMSGVYKGSILFPYFFRNRRKFSEIVFIKETA